MKFSCNTIVFSLLMAFLFLHGCDENSTGPDFSNVPAPYDRSEAIIDSTLEDGSQLFILEQGEGPFEVVPRDLVEVRFTARTETGQIIESTYRLPSNSAVIPTLIPNAMGNISPASPINLVQQLEPFRKAFLKMKEGGKRIIEIPPASEERGRYPITNINLAGKTIIIDFEVLRIL